MCYCCFSSLLTCPGSILSWHPCRATISARELSLMSCHTNDEEVCHLPQLRHTHRHLSPIMPQAMAPSLSREMCISYCLRRLILKLCYLGSRHFTLAVHQPAGIHSPSHLWKRRDPSSCLLSRTVCSRFSIAPLEKYCLIQLFSR
jgi:hypothetical protein